MRHSRKVQGDTQGQPLSQRISTWAYDSQGRSVLSVKGRPRRLGKDGKPVPGTGIEQVNLDYAAGRTTLTNSLGRTTVYTHALVGNEFRLLDVIFAATLVLTLPAHLAYAAPEPELFRMLLCSQPTHDAIVAFNALPKKNIGHNQDNGVILQGEFKSEGACIKNVRVAGAFGVAMTTAEVCDGKMAPLVEVLKTLWPDLQETKDLGKSPGSIAAYGDSKYAISFYRGPPSFIPNPDSRSKIVSYICMRKGSGPQ